MKRPISLILAFALILSMLYFAAPEQAAVKAADDTVTIYVSASGNDTNDGTESAPVATINQAYTLIKEKRGTDYGTAAQNVIYIQDTLTATTAISNQYFAASADAADSVPVTITGASGAGITFTEAASSSTKKGYYYFPGDTVLDGIAITASATTRLEPSGSFTVNDNVTTSGTIRLYQGSGVANFTLNAGTWNTAALKTDETSETGGTAVLNIGGKAIVQTLYVVEFGTNMAQHFTLEQVDINLSGSAAIYHAYLGGCLGGVGGQYQSSTTDKINISITESSKILHIYFGAYCKQVNAQAAKVGTVSVTTSGNGTITNWNYKNVCASDITADPTRTFDIIILTTAADLYTMDYEMLSLPTTSLTVNTNLASLVFDKTALTELAVAVGKDTATVTVPAANIGEIYYPTVADALAAASSGDTVALCNNVETDSAVVIPSGVKLKLGSYTLTAPALVGLGTAQLYGQPGSAKLVVPQDSLVLPEGAFVYNGAYYLPVWDAESTCYVFSAFQLTTDNTEGMTVENGNISFKFQHSASSDVTELLKAADSDKGITVILQLRWTVDGDEAVQNFCYSDAQLEAVTEGGNYTFELTNYAELGIDISTLEVQAMVVSDSGAVAVGDVWVNGSKAA